MARVRERNAGNAVDDGARQQAAEVAAQRRAEAAARRATEEANAAQQTARGAESAMEPQRRVGRQVRASVRFEPAGRRLPQRQERQSVKFTLANARANRVEEEASVSAAEAGVVSSALVRAARAGDVARVERLVLPRIEAAALQAADAVDRVAVRANAAALVGVARSALGAVTEASELQELALGHGLGGIRGQAVDGIREVMPRLAGRLAHAAEWAREGLEMGDAVATRVGLHRQLAEVRSQTEVLHGAVDTLERGQWHGARAMREGLENLEGHAAEMEGHVQNAVARQRFAEGEATEHVNRARVSTGHEALPRHAGPEEWMPAAGEHPDVQSLASGNGEIDRLSAKLEALKARRDAGEDVAAQLYSVKSNLRAAENPPPVQAPAAGVEGEGGMGGEGGLTEADLRRIGSQVPADGGVQVPWMRNDGFAEDRQPGALPSQSADRAREQGLITPQQVDRANELASRTVAGAEARRFEAGDVALLARQAGLPLERMDPNQLAQAARMISAGRTPEEQRAAISVTVQNLSLIAGGTPPTYTREEIRANLWATARIPGHALDRLSPNELQARFQEVNRATNAPGETSVRIGSHTARITVAPDGSLESSSTRRPSLLGRLANVARIAIQVGAIVPGPWQAVFVPAAAAMAAYQAARARSLFGVVTALASVAGPTGQLISRVAQGVNSVANGIRSWRNGEGFLGGLAQVAAGVAQAAGNTLGAWGNRLQNFAAGVGAANGIIQSNRALGEAREALAAARASGNPQAIAAAMEGVEAAERGRRSALLGAGATALSMAARAAPGGRNAAPGQRNGLQLGLQLGAGALNVARGVNDRNFMAAAVDGLAMVADARQGTRAPELNRGADGEWREGRLRTIANTAQALNGWREADVAERAAARGLDQARVALEAARRGGDPEAVAQAEAAYRAARSARGEAAVGTYLQVREAGRAVDAAVTSWRASSNFRAEIEAGFQGTVVQANDGATEIQASRDGRVLSPEQEERARANQAMLAGGQTELAAALASGDRGRIAQAVMNMDAVLEFTRETNANLRTAPEIMRLPVSNRNFGDLIPNLPGTAQSQPAPISFDGTTGPSRSRTIQSGETLSDIARANGMTLDQLLAANPQITNRDRIRAGDAINIPGEGPMAAPINRTGTSAPQQAGAPGGSPTVTIPPHLLPPQNRTGVDPTWMFDEQRWDIPRGTPFVLGPDGRPYGADGRPFPVRPVPSGDYREAGLRLLEAELGSNLPGTTDRRRPQDVLALVVAARGGEEGGATDPAARDTIRRILGRDLTAQEYGDLDHYLDGWNHVEATPRGGVGSSIARGYNAAAGAVGYAIWSGLKGGSQLLGLPGVGGYGNNENTSRVTWDNYNSYNVGARDAIQRGYAWDRPETSISHWEATRAAWSRLW